MSATTRTRICDQVQRVKERLIWPIDYELLPLLVANDTITRTRARELLIEEFDQLAVQMSRGGKLEWCTESQAGCF